jgi:hypothetical protein
MVSIAAHSWARRESSDSFAVGGDDVSSSNSAAHGSQSAADGAFDHAIGLATQTLIYVFLNYCVTDVP